MEEITGTEIQLMVGEYDLLEKIETLLEDSEHTLVTRNELASQLDMTNDAITICLHHLTSYGLITCEAVAPYGEGELKLSVNKELKDKVFTEIKEWKEAHPNGESPVA